MIPRRGPALVYIDSEGDAHDIARKAVQDPVERDLCGVLVGRAQRLAEQVDAEPEPEPFRIGFAGPDAQETPA
jgi:hypothetical protein